IRGIAGGDAGGAALKALSARAIAFFIATTLIAATIGLLVASAIDPGAYIDGGMLETALVSAADATGVLAAPADLPTPEEIPNIITSLFPRDPLTTLIGGDMLEIVITSAIIGAALVMMPEPQRRPLLELLASIQAACMVIVGWVMHFAPFAVFGLLAHITARVGLTALIGTGVYVAAVLIGLAALLAVYLAIVGLIGRYSVRNFLVAVREVMLLAFSTSSSAAVMPLSLTTAEHKLGVRTSVARFVV
ncbi:MAG: cation:dicarboxylase symporter family transporter, partial [Alphaproteobacteria bacterium]